MNKAAKIAIISLAVLVGTLAVYRHNPPRDKIGSGCKAACWRVQVDGPNDFKCQNPYLTSALAKIDHQLPIVTTAFKRPGLPRLDSDSERMRDALLRGF